MSMKYLFAEYEVARDFDKCINCRICEQQCANGVHGFIPYKDENGVVDDSPKMWKLGKMTAKSLHCVNCHRCVVMCPTDALKIVKTDHTFRTNNNWSGALITEIYKQAASGTAVCQRGTWVYTVQGREWRCGRLS